MDHEPVEIESRLRRPGLVMALVLPYVLGLLAGVMLLAGLTPMRRVQAAGTIYVKASSACTVGCGGSWANAYPKLQDALGAAGSGDQIWVARGVYYPDEGSGQTDNSRSSTFALKNGVALYGGFAGTEGSLGQRNVAANPTVLSGDIDKNDAADAAGVVTRTANIVGSNAYHVVCANGVNSSAVLDGFTITAGRASGASPNNVGGGLYNTSSSPTLINMVFSGNLAASQGGGVYNSDSNPTLNAVLFSANAITVDGGSGGGMYNTGSSPTLSVVTFYANTAYHGGGMFNDNSSNATLSNATFSANTAIYGGGMYNHHSNPVLTNVTFSGNSGLLSGGGIRNYFTSTMTLQNVIIANSTAGGDCVSHTGGAVGTGSSNNLIEATGSNACGLTNGVNGNIIGQDPKLGPLQGSGSALTHALLEGSPAIDAGTNTGCPATDQRGLSRPIDGDGNGSAVCDIGAVEYPFAEVFLPLVLRNS